MRTRLLTALFVLSASAAAHAQTAGTTFPNNQDPSTTPAEQSMQEVGGPGGKNIAVVVQQKVKPVPPAPAPAATRHRQTLVKTRSTRPATAAAKP